MVKNKDNISAKKVLKLGPFYLTFYQFYLYINVIKIVKGMANPRGNFKLVSPMKTGESHWELYASIDENHPERHSIDPLDKLVEVSQFKKFVEYAKEQGWKYEDNGYTIPEGNCFYFVEPIIICGRASNGLFRLNDLDIYLPFDYDCLDFDEYEEFGLEEMI